MIPMTDYKVIYQNVIYNVLMICFPYNWNLEKGINKPGKIDVTFLDENNRISIITDEVEEFQFIRK